VRRRLFEPLTGPEQFKQRDVTARAFADLYRRSGRSSRPSAATRLREAHPGRLPDPPRDLRPALHRLVHAGEVPAHRGVLRLMAAVIHSLWEKGDRNPLILPSNIPIDDPRVQFELTRYLSDNWVPIIEKDVDGPNSLPLRSTRAAQPRQAARHPARGAHDLPRLRAHGRAAHRGSRTGASSSAA
jgi:predicted AAA+ superfamily ATPase